MPDARPESGSPADAAHLPATVAIAAAFALLVFSILLAPVHALVPPVELDPPLTEQHQSTETLLYGFTYLLLLPVSAIFSTRLVDRFLAGGNPELLGALSSLTAMVSAGALVLARIAGLGSGRLWLLAGLALAAGLVTGAIWWRAIRTPWPAAARLSGSSPSLAFAAGLVALAAVVSLGYPAHVDLPWLVAGLFAAGVVLGLRHRVRLPRIPRHWGIGLDLVVLGLVILAVPDLIVFQGVGESDLPGNPFQTYVIHFHQSLYLGAVSQILNGSALLVDTVSQYGVASVYALAAIFEFVPLGNGTLAFFDASVFGLTFAGGYAILRLARVGRLLAAATMLFAVTVLVWALEYPIGGLLQHGGLRFGLPMALILSWVAAERFPRARFWLRGLGWFVVGLSSIWALEAFMYVTGALAGMLLLEAALLPAGRWRYLLRQALCTLLAWVALHLLFALATLAGSGSLPDWGMYLTYLRDFLTGDIGDLNYDVPAWSPGLSVGFGYLLSALAVTVIAIRRPDWLRDRPVAGLALAGLAGYGILLFSYFDNRSLSHIIPYVSLPLVLSVGLWLWLVISDPAVTRRAAGGVLAFVLSVAALSVSTVMPAAANRAETSLIAHVLPGGKSARGAFDRLWNPPELVVGANQGAAMLERYLPGQDASPVLTSPDLDNNILTLAGRANSLRITDAKEQSWVPGPHLEPVGEAAAELDAGDRMLVDDASLEAFRTLATDPGADRARITKATKIENIQLVALAEVADRFGLRPVASEGELHVVELVPRDQARISGSK